MALELAFETTGDGPPVIILHGLFGSRTNWRSVAKRLGASHRVASLDLRNHGTSPWADSMTYFEMAEDVRAWIDQHGMTRPALIGHSMGGKVAMALALLHPECVRQLATVDIAPVSYPDELSVNVQAMLGVDVKAAEARAEVQRQMMQKLNDMSTVGFLMQNLVTRDAHFDWRLNLPVINAAMHQLVGFPAELLERRFDGPTTVISGSQSDYVKPADRIRYAALFPRAEFVTIEGAGHWVHADRPEAFVEAVERALDAAS